MGVSFLRGLVASINPCAFVLLPTYLMYFLRMEGVQPGGQRASIRRAIVVSGAVSAGFMSVFVAVGLVSEYVTGWIESNAKYATVVIGVGFVVLGVAMLAGYRLPFSTPRIGQVGGGRDTVLAMSGYGVAYAVTSISCTLPLFSTTLFGNVQQGGWGSGLANVVAYGMGMALVVTALTIALAAANTSLLRTLRAGSQYVDRIAAVFVLLSGLYLVYYFWVVDVNESSSGITDRIDDLRTRLQVQLQDRWQLIAIVLGAIVVAGAVYAWRRPSSSELAPGADEPDRSADQPIA
jgi:cytochrome c-type biogenesis protein